MSTFYGNFTDNSKPSFQFDKIYPNYKIMRALEKSDDVFVGRQILIEYNKNPKDFLLKCAKENNEFKNFCVNKGITFDEENYQYFTINYNDWNNKNWTDDESEENCYILNDYLDLYDDRQSNEDSTVWEKIYNSADGQSYIKIAELNAMIPTLRIVSTTPTTSMEAEIQGTTGAGCIQLNIPKNWNFRVKQVGISSLSDEKIDNGTPEGIPLDIFYNKAGLTGTEVVDGLTNKIEVTPNGEYQELSIHLPAIGNAIAKVNAVKEAMGDSGDTGSTASNATWWAQFKKLRKDMQDRVNDNTLLTKDEAETTYLKIDDAETTYLTPANAAAIYLTTAAAANTYLTIDNAISGYIRKNNVEDFLLQNTHYKVKDVAEEDVSENAISYYNESNDNSWLFLNSQSNGVNPGVKTIQHKQQTDLIGKTKNSANQLQYYGGGGVYNNKPVFYSPRFTIDKAGHITSIDNAHFGINFDNIWLKQAGIEVGDDMFNQTIGHKIQSQLYNTTGNINKVTSDGAAITYGGKITEDDEKIYVPSLTLDEAGHITDINNSSDLMDMLFYHENEEVNGFFPVVGGIVTSSEQRLYIIASLSKILLPGYTLSIADASSDISLRQVRALRWNSNYPWGGYIYTGTGTPAITIEGWSKKTETDDNPNERTVKQFIVCSDYYKKQADNSTLYGFVKITGAGGNCLNIQLDTATAYDDDNGNLHIYPAKTMDGIIADNVRTDYSNYKLLNNSCVYGTVRIKGKIIKQNQYIYSAGNYYGKDNNT